MSLKALLICKKLVRVRRRSKMSDRSCALHDQLNWHVQIMKLNQSEILILKQGRSPTFSLYSYAADAGTDINDASREARKEGTTPSKRSWYSQNIVPGAL